MEKLSTVHYRELEPVAINLGAMVKLSLPIFIEGYEDEEWLTVRDVRDRMMYPSKSITETVRRLSSLYLPNRINPINQHSGDYVQLLHNEPHPTKTIKSEGRLNNAVETYQLSEPGYEWSKIVMDSLKKKRDESFRMRDITSVLMRLPE